MNNKYRKVLLCLPIGFIHTLLLKIPVLNMFVALSALPLLLAVPELRETSEYVEYGPFWITLLAKEAWFMFGGYFIVMYAVIIYLYLKYEA